MKRINAYFKICPDCSYYCLTEEENIFCPFCGEELIDKCQECGEIIKMPHGDYCSKCGTIYPGRKTKIQEKLN